MRWTEPAGATTQEFVRPVASEGDVVGQRSAQNVGDGQERLVAGVVAVRLVEQPEVVDVDQRDADRRVGRAGALDARRHQGDECPVVERAGQRVAIERIDERLGLARDAALGRAEHEIQDDRRDEPGRQRHEDDVPADRIEGREDRRRVAPHADHAADLPVGDQREVFADHVSRRERRPGRLAQLCVGDAGRRGLAAERGREVGRRRADQATRRGVVGRQDAPVGPADLDPQDLARPDERCQSPLERGLALRRRAGRSQIVRKTGCRSRTGGRARRRRRPSC